MPSDPDLLSDSDLETRARDLFSEHFLDQSDFTLLLTDNALGQKYANDPRWWYRYCCHKTNTTPSEGTRKSFEFQERVTPFGGEEDCPARLQVSRTLGATAWSVTVRWSPRSGGIPRPIGPKGILDLGWIPGAGLSFKRNEAGKMNASLFSFVA